MIADLVVDPERLVDHADRTGFYCHATLDGRWGSYDMAQLTKESFTQFVQQGGEVTVWALSIFYGLFGYPR